MTSGEGYAQRHLQQSDYFDQNRTVEGMWHGRGAELLGLKGEVMSDDFEAVRQGIDPRTAEFLRQRHSADRRATNGAEQSKARSLYDMTFSAPKSVSVMAIVGGDERLVAAHETAVREALEEAERYSATRVRVTGLNENRTAGNWVVAAYTHDSSRQLDPQLHTHAVAANLTYDGTEGRWKALQASGFYERRRYLTEVYRNALAREVRALGYEIENRHDVHINTENPRTSLTPISVQTLVEHYREKELGPDCTKSRKTQVTYAGYFRKWILPRWGSYRVTEVKAVAVEQWLRSLKYANGSKAKARNIMSAVFNHAVRWEWLDVNPIRMVRQSAKRTRMLIVLSIEQIAALLRILKEPTRTMVFLAVFTGLRVGELLGLKWKDIDFQKMEVHVIRSIVMQHVGDCKTEASRKPVPLDLRLANVLWSWRLQSPYPTDEDWVFASPHSGGKLPYWPGSLYKAHLEPAAKEIGIVGHFGWHTFRHTYATLLKGNGEDVKVVQELMRHANISVTLNVYAQAITKTKRDAQSRVVSLLLDKNGEKPSTEAYRTVTDLQNSGGDLQVVDKVGVPDGI